MKLLNHITAQPFVFSTSIAAAIHLTWTVATITGGIAPTPIAGNLETIIAWVFWVIPGILLAVALDVGQIHTAYEIREGRGTTAHYATFIILAIATYYFQWFHLVHHLPTLALAPGITEGYETTVTGIRNAVVWIYPALFPTAMILYTLSGKKKETIPAFLATSNASIPPPTNSASAPAKSVLGRLRASVNVAANGHSPSEAVPPAASSIPPAV